MKTQYTKNIFNICLLPTIMSNSYDYFTIFIKNTFVLIKLYLFLLQVMFQLTITDQKKLCYFIFFIEIVILFFN